MQLLPWMIAIPLGAGFALPLMPKERPRVSNVLANAATLALLLLCVSMMGHRSGYPVGGWQPPLGINLVLDGLSWLMLSIVAVVSFAATLFSTRYMDRYTGRPKYFALFLIMVAGMNGAILTGDMFNLYVFIEVAAVSSYALVAFGCGQQELEAAFKYAILGAIASAFILLGVALLYCQFGTVNMAHLGQKLPVAMASAVDPARGTCVLSLALLVAGLGLKAALVPFHAWLPDAHPSAPAPISAMLSGVLIKAVGVYALLRVAFTVFGITYQMAKVLMILGTLSMVVGVVLALAQRDMKRLLAYSSISQIGYIVLGVGAGGAVLASGGERSVAALAIVGGLFHLVNHAVFKSLLFLTAGAVEYGTGTRQLEEMGGLRERMPVTAGTSLVASMAIGGIPPFNGFVSKLVIILACVRAGFYGYAAWAVIVSVMTIALFMRLQKRAFFGKLPDRWKSLREVPSAMGAAMVLLAILCGAMSLLILPGARKGVLDPAQRGLTDRDQYIQNALWSQPWAARVCAARPEPGPETEDQ
jgi:multicomponent Na+:H+ antiporter subunit D